MGFSGRVTMESAGKGGLNEPDLSRLTVISFCVHNGILFAGTATAFSDPTTMERRFIESSKDSLWAARSSSFHDRQREPRDRCSEHRICDFEYRCHLLSDNDGVSWHQSSFPRGSIYVSCVAPMEAPPLTPALRRRFHDHGVFKSIDKGVTWTSMTFSLNADVDLLAVQGANVLAANLFSAFYSRTAARLCRKQPSRGWHLHVYHPQRLHLAGIIGMNYSTNQGASWNPANQGFACPRPAMLGSCVNGAYLFAGADDNGLWRISLAEFGVTGIGDDEIAIPRRYQLFQNHPNPFNPTTTIRYELVADSDVHLEIYDASAKRVRVLVAGQVESAGRHEVTWNGRDDGGRRMASGVYSVD